MPDDACNVIPLNLPNIPGPYDVIADHIMRARAIAASHQDAFLAYLLDMALIEIATRSAAEESA